MTKVLVYYEYVNIKKAKKKKISPTLIYSLLGLALLLGCLLFIIELDPVEKRILETQYTAPDTSNTIDKIPLTYDGWFPFHPYLGFRVRAPINWHVVDSGKFTYETPLYGYQKTTYFFSPGFDSGSKKEFALHSGVKRGARIKIVITLFDERFRKPASSADSKDFCTMGEIDSTKYEALTLNDINKLKVCKIQLLSGASNEITYNLRFEDYYYKVILNFNSTNESEEVIRYYQNVAEKLIASFDTYSH